MVTAKLIVACLLIAVLAGCDGELPRTTVPNAVVRADALAAYQEAVAEHKELLMQREAEEQATQEGVKQLRSLAENSADDPAFVQEVESNIAQQERLSREFREEIDAKIAAKAELVAARKAALSAAEQVD